MTVTLERRLYCSMLLSISLMSKNSKNPEVGGFFLHGKQTNKQKTDGLQFPVAMSKQFKSRLCFHREFHVVGGIFLLSASCLNSIPWNELLSLYSLSSLNFSKLEPK